MLSIRSEEFIRYERGLSVVRMEIDVDTAEEIPDINGSKKETILSQKYSVIMKTHKHNFL